MHFMLQFCVDLFLTAVEEHNLIGCEDCVLCFVLFNLSQFFSFFLVFFSSCQDRLSGFPHVNHQVQVVHVVNYPHQSSFNLMILSIFKCLLHSLSWSGHLLCLLLVLPLVYAFVMFTFFFPVIITVNWSQQIII